MGDDAADLLILDTAFNVISTRALFPQWDRRVAKSLKADLESSDLVKRRQGDELWLFGSGTLSPYRDSLYRFRIDSQVFKGYNIAHLFDKIRNAGVEALNIEGAAHLRRRWIFGNRGNTSHTQNFLITTPEDFDQDLKDFPVDVIPLKAPTPDAGISGLAYVPGKDILFLTFSEEDTANAYDDGETGSSYLALIDNISKQFNRDTLRTDAWLAFPSVHPTLHKMKVESIALERRSKGELILYLTADNDDGKTSLYKLQLELP